MTRFCANCGTEVDEAAVFCPTCGQPVDEAAASEIPAAPAWPDPPPDQAGASAERAAPAAFQARADPEPAADAAWPEYGGRDVGGAGAHRATEAPTRVEQRPPPAADATPGEPAPAVAAPAALPPDHGRESGDGGAGARSGLPQVDLPLTMPVTLSGWLIGGGTLLAALGVIVILVVTSLNAIDLLLLVALLAVAATVFLAARMPAIPNLRLISLVVSLIAFGVALDRVGFGGGGVGELLLFMGAAAAAIGAVILELGQDQPLGGPQR